ncbi:MAG: helix-turn-helix transcriptional regulator [Verrucomicrobia bacterium]|jgi:HTH-type transcriptional regulator, competence development regulator|nr:helix-turn-helix transcriptional regulator [Verrucomicrobiota bacterium]
MSRQSKSKSKSLDENPLGKWLRQMRKDRGVPLRVVAAAAEMDIALLSKVELGQRLPTEKQTAAFAAFFGVRLEEMEAMRIAEKFWMEHGNSAGTEEALSLINKAAKARKLGSQ